MSKSLYTYYDLEKIYTIMKHVLYHLIFERRNLSKGLTFTKIVLQFLDCTYKLNFKRQYQQTKFF